VKNPSEIVVLFKTHLRAGADKEEYAKTSRRMHELVETIPGFISIKGYTGRTATRLISSASRRRRRLRHGGHKRSIE